MMNKYVEIEAATFGGIRRRISIFIALDRLILTSFLNFDRTGEDIYYACTELDIAQSDIYPGDHPKGIQISEETYNHLKKLLQDRAENIYDELNG